MVKIRHLQSILVRIPKGVLLLSGLYYWVVLHSCCVSGTSLRRLLENRDLTFRGLFWYVLSDHVLLVCLQHPKLRQETYIRSSLRVISARANWHPHLYSGISSRVDKFRVQSESFLPKCHHQKCHSSDGYMALFHFSSSHFTENSKPRHWRRRLLGTLPWRGFTQVMDCAKVAFQANALYLDVILIVKIQISDWRFL